MVKIYTKTGDLGTTSLLGKLQVSKTDFRIQAYGELDELNAHLGEMVLYLDSKDQELVQEIISEIFNISSHIACVSESFENMLASLHEELLVLIEERIDEITQDLEPLKSFILPIGSFELTRIHQVRTITRRCERSLVHIKEEIDPYILKLVNRLSDYCFTLARKYTKDHNQEEAVWKNS